VSPLIVKPGSQEYVADFPSSDTSILPSDGFENAVHSVKEEKFIFE
jgi:hypothetical protein